MSKVTFSTLMNPFIKIGGRVNLSSKVAPHLDGIYRVDSIVYNGDNRGQDWKQDCTGFLVNSGVTVL